MPASQDAVTQSETSGSEETWNSDIRNRGKYYPGDFYDFYIGQIHSKAEMITESKLKLKTSTEKETGPGHTTSVSPLLIEYLLRLY